MTLDTANMQSVEWEPTAVGRPPRGVTRALVMDEAVRSLKHPLTLAAAILQTVLWVYDYVQAYGPNGFPVMTDVDHTNQVPLMLLLGSAAFLTGNLAIIRSARFRTDQYFVVMPLHPWNRAFAAVLSTTVVGVLSLLMTVVHLAILQSSAFAAGSANIYEVVAGPLAVLLLGFSGVLLGLFLKSPVVAPLALLMLGAVMAVATFPLGLGASRFRWLLPLAVEDVTAFPMPGNLLDRPAGSHLIYLLGMVLVVSTAAVGREASRRKLVGMTTVILAVLTASAGYVQLSGPTRSLADARTNATLRPAAQQVCETDQNVTYCSFEQFRPWIQDWKRVTGTVLSNIPGDHPNLYVRQRVFVAGRNAGGIGIVPSAPSPEWQKDDELAGTPDAISIGTAWGTGAGELELAASVAARFVLKGSATGTRQVCGGQAVTILWIAGSADARALREMRSRAGNGSGDLVLMPAGFSDGLAFNRQDLGVALGLIAQQGRDPREAAAHWAALTDPKTSTAEAVKMLGVAYPSALLPNESWC